MNENVDIFICAHSDVSEYPHNKVYKIIAGEGDLTKDYDIETYAEKDSKYIHIQKYVCEFTRMYWVRHNVELKDYVGFCHYGRFFNFYDDVPDIDELFKKYDLITNKPLYLNMNAQYSRSHDIRDYDLMKQIMLQQHKDITLNDIQIFEQSLYNCNMFIMRKQDFCDYVDFVSGIIDEFIRIRGFNDIGNIRKYVEDNWSQYNKNDVNVIYQMRIIAFLSERISTFYFKKYHKNIKNYDMVMKNKDKRAELRKIYYDETK